MTKAGMTNMMWMCPGSAAVIIEHTKEMFLPEDKNLNRKIFPSGGHEWFFNIRNEWKLKGEDYWGSPWFVWFSHMMGMKLYHLEVEKMHGDNTKKFGEKMNFDFDANITQIVEIVKSMGKI